MSYFLTLAIEPKIKMQQTKCARYVESRWIVSIGRMNVVYVQTMVFIRCVRQLR